MKEKTFLTTEDCLFLQGNIYFFAEEINALCKLDLNTRIVSMISSIPEEDVLGVRLGMAIVNVQDYLFVSPMNAKKIWRFNLKTQEWKSYERKKIKGTRSNAEMLQMIVFNNKVFVIGSNYPAIVVIDVITDSVEYIEKPYERYTKTMSSRSDFFFRTDNVIVGDYMYLVSCIENTVLKLSLVNYEYEYISVGEKNNTYVGIGYDGEKFYLAPREGNRMVIWDGVDEWSVCLLSKYGTVRKDTHFMGVVCWKDKIILPDYANETIIYSKNDDSISKSESFYFMKKISEESLICLTKDGKMKICTNENINNYNLEIEKKMITSFINKFRRGRGILSIIKENVAVDLEEFIKIFV